MRNMGEERSAVAMVRYECHTCGLGATCVVTPASELAWLDHMATHHLEQNYSSWTWDVIPLFEPPY